MKELIPFICIGGVVFIVANNGGLTHTDPPINYPTGHYNGLIQPYNPIPQMPSAHASKLERNVESIANQLLEDAVKQHPHLTLPSQAKSPGAYDNGYTSTGHQNTVIGDMVHQMRHEGAIRPETLDAGDDILWRCAKLDPAPPICN